MASCEQQGLSDCRNGEIARLFCFNQSIFSRKPTFSNVTASINSLLGISPWMRLAGHSIQWHGIPTLRYIPQHSGELINEVADSIIHQRTKRKESEMKESLDHQEDSRISFC